MVTAYSRHAELLNNLILGFIEKDSQMFYSKKD